MLAWLKREPQSMSSFALIALIVIIYDLLQSLVVVLYLQSGWHEIADMIKTRVESHYASVSPWIIMRSAIAEEVVYRILPVSIFLRLGGNDRGLIVVILCSSTLFGCVHAAGLLTVFFIAIGIVLSLLYLKCSGTKAMTVEAVCITIGAHYFANLFIYTGLGFA